MFVFQKKFQTLVCFAQINHYKYLKKMIKVMIMSLVLGHVEAMMTPDDFLRSITPGMKQPENLGLVSDRVWFRF